MTTRLCDIIHRLGANIPQQRVCTCRQLITRCCVLPDPLAELVTASFMCRTGICLPLVCKAFRRALLDMQHVGLWGTAAPLSCVAQHVMPATPDRWILLQEWLELRGPTIRALHIE
jgi:hypothetical protein